MSFLLAFWSAKLCYFYELCLQTEGVKAAWTEIGHMSTECGEGKVLLCPEAACELFRSALKL